ncbi:MAG TPA: hypothetical protein VHO66_09710 [Ruminiclostridium sp.]|nr:hypothetical protein [Ruminiclostridium sp.]
MAVPPVKPDKHCYAAWFFLHAAGFYVCPPRWLQRCFKILALILRIGRQDTRSGSP